jgi:hypothetical protein
VDVSDILPKLWAFAANGTNFSHSDSLLDDNQMPQSLKATGIGFFQAGRFIRVKSHSSEIERCNLALKPKAGRQSVACRKT